VRKHNETSLEPFEIGGSGIAGHKNVTQAIAGLKKTKTDGQRMQTVKSRKTTAKGLKGTATRIEPTGQRRAIGREESRSSLKGSNRAAVMK
jgi:hypothetical protein